MILKERFWLRGDQKNLYSKLTKKISDIKNSDRYSDFRQYKGFVIDILELTLPILEQEYESFDY
jgi:hypothetical protein